MSLSVGVAGMGALQSRASLAPVVFDTVTGAGFVTHTRVLF